jgi:hypothetical protein
MTSDREIPKDNFLRQRANPAFHFYVRRTWFRLRPGTTTTVPCWRTTPCAVGGAVRMRLVSLTCRSTIPPWPRPP